MTVSSFPNVIDNFPEMSLADLINGARKRLYLIYMGAFFGILIGLASLWIFPRKYEAQTMVELDMTAQNYGISSNPLSPQPPFESIILSQVEILQSRDLSEMLLNDLDLESNPDFWQGKGQPENRITRHQKAIFMLTDNLKVNPVGRSLVMDIRYRHANAALAAKITNRFAELYQEQQVKEKVELSKKVAIELQARLEILGKKLRESAKAVEEYSAKEDLVDGAKAEVTSQQISDISSQLVLAQAEEAGVKARQSQIQDVIKNKKSDESTTDVMQSHRIELLKSDEANIVSQLAQLQSRYGSNHPKILALQAELAEIRSKQRFEIGTINQNVDNEVNSIQAKIQLLQKKLQDLEDKRKRENHAAIGLKELQREADANRSLYETFLGKYKETKMLGDLQQPDTKIISIARVPVKLSGINPAMIVMLTSFAGFCFGFILVLLLEQLDMTIKSPEQIRQLTGLETLGSFPETNEIAFNKIADYTLENPYTPLTEALRNFCIRLISQIEKTPAIICFCSASGKKSTKLLIWMSKLLAKSGLKILLLDADLRNPSFNHYFDIHPAYPLTDAILGKRFDENFIFKDSKIELLSAMSGTISPASDVTLLSKERTQQFLGKLKESYDLILIDTAAIHIAETQLFYKIADYTVLVQPFDAASAKQFLNTVRQLQMDKCNLIGVILSECPEYTKGTR